MTNLSICIPTYNRTKYLENCLNSILIATKKSDLKIEVCISDNYLKKIPIRLLKLTKNKIVFNQNNKNIGYGRNSLKAFQWKENLYGC